MMYHLFNERWITNTEVETNENGCAKFKGYYGTYEIDADGKKFTVSVKSNIKNEIELQL